MADKIDPWDELMAVAHTYAVDSYEDSKVCENCLGEWPHFEPEHHEPDCPVRPDRENPYAGLVEALESALVTMRHARVFVDSRERIKRPEGIDLYDESVAAVETALTKVRGDA